MRELIDILLVEDNPGDVRLAQETLKDYKMQNALHVVTDGEAAISYLLRKAPYENAPRPDLVLLDLSLPKLDGPEVLEEMHKHEALRELPVVILTSSRFDRELARRYRIEADCFIQKPLTLERYLDAVRCFPQFGLSIVQIMAT